MMAKELPEWIQIGAATFSVGRGTCETDGCFCSGDSPNIIIDKTVPDSLLGFVACHELGHAVSWEFGFAENNDRFADIFAQAVISVIRDNPEFVRLLQEK